MLSMTRSLLPRLQSPSSCDWRRWSWRKLTSRCCRLGKPPDVVVVSSNLWDASLYAKHGAARSADLPPDLVEHWLEDAGTVFAEIKVAPKQYEQSINSSHESFME